MPLPHTCAGERSVVSASSRKTSSSGSSTRSSSGRHSRKPRSATHQQPARRAAGADDALGDGVRYVRVVAALGLVAAEVLHLDLRPVWNMRGGEVSSARCSSRVDWGSGAEGLRARSNPRAEQRHCGGRGAATHRHTRELGRGARQVLHQLALQLVAAVVRAHEQGQRRRRRRGGVGHAAQLKGRRAQRAAGGPSERGAPAGVGGVPEDRAPVPAPQINPSWPRCSCSAGRRACRAAFAFDRMRARMCSFASPNENAWRLGSRSSRGS